MLNQLNKSKISTVKYVHKVNTFCKMKDKQYITGTCHTNFEHKMDR